MKIWHISDTHGFHKQLIIPKDIDVVAFTGDESNNIDPNLNHNEFLLFVNWFSKLDIKHKLFIPGNHSSFIFHNRKTANEILKTNGITMLDKTSITIDGLKFYGDPIVPRYKNWVYMADREKMNKHWQLIPEDTDILMTHTPPKGILDLTENINHQLEQTGCSALRKRIQKLPNIKVHLFGHIHNNQDIVNIGSRKLDHVIYLNGASVKDGRFDLGIIHHGNIIEIA